jgi:hypothetical protein
LPTLGKGSITRTQGYVRSRTQTNHNRRSKKVIEEMSIENIEKLLPSTNQIC